MPGTKIVVAGGYGCGTTHVYRIVRQLIDRTGVPYIGRGISHDDLEAEGLLQLGTSFVLKTHDAVLAKHADHRVLLCKRDLFDAAASHLRRSSMSQAIAGVRQRREIERGYADRTDVLTVDYETWYGRPLEKVRAIADWLGVDLDSKQLLRVARNTGIAATREYVGRLHQADAVTELRPGHIGRNDGRPGAGSRLSADLKSRIGSAYEGV